MSDNYDEPDDETDEEYDAAYEAHRTALYDLLMAYADKEELSDGFMAQIVSDLGLSLRMVAYASETEKPSMGGLRLDLERYTRELGESVRDAKKHAGEFIAEVKAARDEQDGEEDGDEDEDGDEAKPDTPRS